MKRLYAVLLCMSDFDSIDHVYFVSKSCFVIDFSERGEDGIKKFIENSLTDESLQYTSFDVFVTEIELPASVDGCISFEPSQELIVIED